MRKKYTEVKTKFISDGTVRFCSRINWHWPVSLLTTSQARAPAAKKTPYAPKRKEKENHNAQMTAVFKTLFFFLHVFSSSTLRTVSSQISLLKRATTIQSLAKTIIYEAVC